MKKKFTIILSSVVALSGLLSVIYGIIVLSNSTYESKYFTIIGTVLIIFGLLSMIGLIGSILNLLNIWKKRKEHGESLFASGLFILGQGIALLFAFFAIKDSDSNLSTNICAADCFISVFGGVLTILISFELMPIILRKLFGIIGFIFGIVGSIIACSGFIGNSAMMYAVSISGLISFVGNIIYLILLKENKIDESNEKQE